MNRKIATIFMGCVMTAAIGISSFAASKQTQVTYKGKGVESWTLTAPAILTPNEAGTTGSNNSGEVIAKGTWQSDKTLVVTASDAVTVVNSININDTKELEVNFDGIELEGSNEDEVEETAEISVGDISNALFGTWEGTIIYHVELQSAD